MKVARTKAQLKHLKTKRKKAKDKRQRRQARERTTGMMMAMRVDDAREGAETPVVEADVDEETRGTAAAPSGRARQSDVARRKRELRDRIAELKSKRSKIGKKNFGKSEERKRLTMMIKELEKERAAVCAGGGGDVGAEDEGDKDDAMVDAH